LGGALGWGTPCAPDRPAQPVVDQVEELVVEGVPLAPRRAIADINVQITAGQVRNVAPALAVVAARASARRGAEGGSWWGGFRRWCGSGSK